MSSSTQSVTRGLNIAFIFWLFVGEVLAQSCQTITSKVTTSCSACPSATYCDFWTRYTIPCGCPATIPVTTSSLPCVAGCAGRPCYTNWVATQLCPDETFVSSPTLLTTTTRGPSIPSETWSAPSTLTTPTLTSKISTTTPGPMPPPSNCPTITSTYTGAAGCPTPSPQLTTSSVRIVCDIFSSLTVPCGCPSIVPRVTTTVCPTPGGRSCGTSWGITTTSGCYLITTSTKTTTQTTIPAPGILSKWSQCGGINWSGTGTCVSGTTCVFVNSWYSQCQ